MSRVPNIVVVGSLNVDLVVTVDSFPAPGETLLGRAFRQVGGGKGANQAVAAARLGAPVSFIARVGDDAFGRSAIAALEAEGIDCRFVLTTPNTPTGIAAITVQESTGENNIVVVPGANGCLNAADIENAKVAFDVADVMILLSLEIPFETVEAAIRYADENGIVTVLNPAPARILPAELLKRIRVLTPNETEVTTLTGIADVEAAAIQLASRLDKGGMVVVTRGGTGVLCVEQDGTPFALPAFPADAVDTVGAGDCFTAALTLGLFENPAIQGALKFALAAAALAVTKTGAQDAMPRRGEVEAFLKDKLAA